MSVGLCKCSPKCRFKATGGEPYFVMHDPRPERRKARSQEAARRGRRGQRKTAAAKAAGARTARSSVPLSTPTQIREYLEQLAAIVEGAKGGALDRVNAGVKVATAAGQLIKDELEKRGAEVLELLERYGELQKEPTEQ